VPPSQPATAGTQPAKRPGIAGVLAVGLAVGLTAAIVFALRIVELDEAATERARHVVLLAGVAGFFSGTTIALPALWFTQGWRGSIRGLIAAPLMAGAFAAAMPFFFAVNMRNIEEREEMIAHHRFNPRQIFWSHVGAFGLFTPQARRYFLPWPLVVIGLAGGLSLWVWPSRGGRP